jgi:hypothetical protein
MGIQTATSEEKTSYAVGTKFTAQGALWTLVSCGNGRYGLRAAGEKRTYTMPCAELHADIKAGRAFVTEYPYRPQVVAGVHYKNVMRNFQKAVRHV